MSDFRPLVLIPTFNTGKTLLQQTVAGALEKWPEVMVVVDGSTDGSDLDLENVDERLQVLRLEKNSGKGSAVLLGIRKAHEQGYTHALTMDADGQHPADWIEKFMEAGRKNPEALVLGQPIFDASAPAIRVNGRKLSNWWANLETMFWGIGDSLFGMRLYPIRELQAAFDSTVGARRFDFDPEVAVRMCWQGVPVLNLKTPVRYLSEDEGGVSQFRYLRDNVLLTRMHARLLGGFLLRSPRLLFRKSNPLKNQND